MIGAAHRIGGMKMTTIGTRTIMVTGIFLTQMILATKVRVVSPITRTGIGTEGSKSAMMTTMANLVTADPAGMTMIGEDMVATTDRAAIAEARAGRADLVVGNFHNNKHPGNIEATRDGINSVAARDGNISVAVRATTKTGARETLADKMIPTEILAVTDKVSAITVSKVDMAATMSNASRVMQPTQIG